MLQLVATAATIAGASVALAFPIVALARHRRGGPLRFLGLPEWATALAACGMAALAAGFVALALVSVLPVDARMTAVLVARPVVAGGSGARDGRRALRRAPCGAAWRRRATAPTQRRSKPGRVEVTHPPELRTHVA